MRIAFGGDVFLGGDLKLNRARNILNCISFHDADIRIVNLEHPIAENLQVANKSVLYAGTESLKLLKRLNINVVSLANNHIHDKGFEGIQETINNLNQANIGWFGAGMNISEASKPYWLNKETCILGYCQTNSPTLNDIQVADVNTPGVNPLSYSNVLQDIQLLPDEVEVILYIHWGREHNGLPSQSQKDLVHSLIHLRQISLILGSHPHVIQPWRYYKNLKVYFSLGNFIFPNFHIEPPVQLFNGSIDKHENTPVTYSYHPVNKITYKKWRTRNRTSLIAIYDTERKQFSETILRQSRDVCEIYKLKRWNRLAKEVKFTILSAFLYLPKWLYIPLEKLFVVITLLKNKSYSTYKRVSQNGFLWLLKKIYERMGLKIIK